jgi:hypothetical protein
VRGVASSWGEPDVNVEKRQGFSFDAMQELYPEFYASRSKGTRKFIPYHDTNDEKREDRAARHVQAVARGFVDRRMVRRWLAHKYEKVLDRASKYYYFRDKITQETSWSKPSLAWHFSIKNERLDLREGGDQRASGFSDGPLLTRGSKSGKTAARWVRILFYILPSFSCLISLCLSLIHLLLPV